MSCSIITSRNNTIILVQCLIVLLRDVSHIGLVIGPREAQPNANTADRGPITTPI